MRLFSIVSILLLLFFASPVWADPPGEQTTTSEVSETENEASETENASEDKNSSHRHSHRPDFHAPIGVMGDHLHKKDEWMVSWRYRHMNMDGSLVGSRSVSDREVLSVYPVAPTAMVMNGHIFGVMYAPSDEVTLMTMVPVMDKWMDHVTRRGQTFGNAINAGLGDVRVGALVKLWENENHHLHFNAGLSLPTGSTDVRATTPQGPDKLLAYPMQLGSGTVDLLPGITYTGFREDWSWGAQAMGTLRMGTNKRGYAQGSAAELTAWGARKLNDHFSSSLRLYGVTWGDVRGRDLRLPASNFMAPPLDPSLRAGRRLDLLVGLNSKFGGHRLAVEGGVPIAQSLDPYQLKTTWTLTAGYQYSF